MKGSAALSVRLLKLKYFNKHSFGLLLKFRVTFIIPSPDNEWWFSSCLIFFCSQCITCLPGHGVIHPTGSTFTYSRHQLIIHPCVSPHSAYLKPIIYLFYLIVNVMARLLASHYYVTSFLYFLYLVKWIWTQVFIGTNSHVSVSCHVSVSYFVFMFVFSLLRHGGDQQISSDLIFSTVGEFKRQLRIVFFSLSLLL